MKMSSKILLSTTTALYLLSHSVMAMELDQESSVSSHRAAFSQDANQADNDADRGRISKKQAIWKKKKDRKKVAQQKTIQKAQKTAERKAAKLERARVGLAPSATAARPQAAATGQDDQSPSTRSTSSSSAFGSTSSSSAGSRAQDRQFVPAAAVSSSSSSAQRQDQDWQLVPASAAAVVAPAPSFRVTANDILESFGLTGMGKLEFVERFPHMAPHVTSLDFSGEETLAELSDVRLIPFRNLRVFRTGHLFLPNTVTDEAFRRMTRLEFLDAFGDWLTDEVTDNKPRLQCVTASGKRLSDGVVSKLKHLRMVKLCGNQFGDGAVENLSALEAMWLGGDGFTDRATSDKPHVRVAVLLGGFKVLTDMQNLEDLWISTGGDFAIGPNARGRLKRFIVNGHEMDLPEASSRSSAANLPNGWDEWTRQFLAQSSASFVAAGPSAPVNVHGNSSESQAQIHAALAEFAIYHPSPLKKQRLRLYKLLCADIANGDVLPNTRARAKYLRADYAYHHYVGKISDSQVLLYLMEAFMDQRLELPSRLNMAVWLHHLTTGKTIRDVRTFAENLDSAIEDHRKKTVSLFSSGTNSSFVEAAPAAAPAVVTSSFSSSAGAVRTIPVTDRVFIIPGSDDDFREVREEVLKRAVAASGNSGASAAADALYGHPFTDAAVVGRHNLRFLVLSGSQFTDNAAAGASSPAPQQTGGSPSSSSAPVGAHRKTSSSKG